MRCPAIRGSQRRLISVDSRHEECQLRSAPPAREFFCCKKLSSYDSKFFASHSHKYRKDISRIGSVDYPCLICTASYRGGKYPKRIELLNGNFSYPFLYVSVGYAETFAQSFAFSTFEKKRKTQSVKYRYLFRCVTVSSSLTAVFLSLCKEEDEKPLEE